MPFTVADAVAALEAAYDPALAESWDSVGLTVGDPAAPVRRALFAVDPTAAVVDEALAWGADLIVTHHPLLLRGVHSVATTTAKGRTVHRLITGGAALFTAHTNADRARPGVSDALARAVGLTGDLRPIEPVPGDPALGLGRVGVLPEPVALAAFAARAAAGLPATAPGLRVSGNPETPVRTIAVSGGAGDSLFDAVRAAGADVFLTADLRHHPASEFVEAHGVALVDAAHWATEWPWLADAAARLEHASAAREDEPLETRVSALVTDAWNFVPHRGAVEPEGVDVSP
ncbi:MAG TPA: Nif3-like dinuclear metal center hexameric protein [Streptosporangiaceae bacterium]